MSSSSTPFTIETPDNTKKQSQTPRIFSPYTVSRAACKLYHSLVIGKRGDVPQLFGWGRNHNNVLGLGVEVLERSYPAQVAHFAKSHVSEIACGLNHTVVVIKQPGSIGGKVYACGLGNRGRLGFTKSDTQEESQETNAWFTPKPIRVRFPNRSKICRISCGSDHTLAITDKGELYAWGVGQYGNLGNGNCSDGYCPIRIKCGAHDSVVTHCAGGGKHSLACTVDGRCYSWGHGGNGRLGLGHSRAVLVPTVIDYISDREIIYVTAGEAHSACIDSLGVLYTWGAGAYGRLGHGDDTDMPVPRKVEEFGGSFVIQAACGTFHTLAVLKTGALYGWGSGLGAGLVAEGDNTAMLVPKQIQEGHIGSTLCYVAAGTYHSIALSIAGDVFCWGVGGHSRLGHGDNVNQPYPRQVAELRNKAFVDDLKALMLRTSAQGTPPSQRRLSGMQNDAWRVTSIQCGKSHTLILCATGDIWVWGSNSLGQLGLGEQSDEEIYEPVHLKVFKEPIKRISCGMNHSVAVSIRGEIFVWGDGSQGQLGLGRIMDVYVPTGITTLNGVFDVTAGDDYTACLAVSAFNALDEANVFAEAGDLWTWGSCETGKLGHEGLSSGSCVAPKKVQLSLPISKVACGRSHMLACSPNGNVFSWGAGYYGRLGNGSSANSSIPLKVPFPSDVTIVDVSAGAFHSMALSNQGSIWIWGRDISVCSKSHIMSPELFEGLEGPQGVPACKSILCSGEHSFAVTRTGQAWSWGDNRNFQLGIGKKAEEFVELPQLLTGLNDAVETLGTSDTHTVVALRRGAVFSWGSTASGCLGSGFKKSKYVTDPEPIDALWAEGLNLTPQSAKGDVNIMMGTGGVRRENENYEIGNVNGIENKVTVFLDQLRYSSEATSFGAIQELLKNEPRTNRYNEIKVLEDDLIKIFGRFLDTILTLSEAEREWHGLEYKVERQLTRVIVNVECDSPETIIARTKGSNQYEATECYTSKQEQIQELAYCLQMQPAYFVCLAAAIRSELERQALLTSIKQIYWDIDDQHINAAFLGLSAAICTAEIDTAVDVLNLFKPRDSTFINLFAVYATMTPNLLMYGHNLVDPKSEGSASSIIEAAGDRYFALDIDKFQELAELGGSKALKGTKDIQRLFHNSLDSISSTLCMVPNSLQLPVGVCALFKHAHDGIVARELVLDAGTGIGRSNLDSFYPLVRLLLQGIVGRVWKDPSRYAKALMCLPFQSPTAEINIRTLWIFINSAFEDDFANYRSSHVLREVFQRVYQGLCNAAARFINCTSDGYIRVQLTLSLYLTHFVEKTHFVTLRSDSTAILINLLKHYEARLQLSVYDPVAEVLKSMSSGPGPIFNRETISLLEAKPFHHNVHINRKFLLESRNTVIDPLANAPVPQTLAFRQQAEGRAVIALVQRYIPPDTLDPRSIIEEALRILPPVSAKTWDSLVKEFEVLQEYFTRLQPPEFAKAQLAAKAAKYALNFETHETPTIDIFKWLAEGLRRRQKHRTYLDLIQAGEETVSNWERKYKFEIQKRITLLNTVVESVGNLEIEEEIRFELTKHKLIPKIDVIATRAGREHGTEETKPSVSIPLRILIRIQVVVRCTFSSLLIPKITVVFTSSGQGNWATQILESTRVGDRSIDQFDLSWDEILRLRRLPLDAEVSYGTKCITFQVASLLQLLMRASVQAIRTNIV